MAAFAAFHDEDIHFSPHEGKTVSVNPGASRTFCDACGSSLTGRYTYIPSQVYVSIGVIDQASELAPKLHSHASEQLPWLHISDDLERAETSASDSLNKASKT